AKKATAKKATAKKATAKKATAKKAPAKKAPAKKAAAKKATAAQRTISEKPAASDVELVIGDVAPDFDLPAADGNRYSKALLAGQRFVLYFYPRDNTSGCTTEAKEFTELLPNFEELGIQVIGVSTDSVESHAKFREKQGIG